MSCHIRNCPNIFFFSYQCSCHVDGACLVGHDLKVYLFSSVPVSFHLFCWLTFSPSFLQEWNLRQVPRLASITLDKEISSQSLIFSFYCNIQHFNIIQSTGCSPFPKQLPTIDYAAALGDRTYFSLFYILHVVPLSSSQSKL